VECTWDCWTVGWRSTWWSVTLRFWWGVSFDVLAQLEIEALLWAEK
jgi:hypothetical protein